MEEVLGLGTGGDEVMVHRWQRPRLVQECRLILSICIALVSSCLRVCVCMHVAVLFFSVSTGELKYGDVCDTFMHVKKAFSSFCCGQSGHPLSLCPEKAIIFPNRSHLISLLMWTGYHTWGKSFWKDKMEVFEKEKRKPWNHILFLQNYYS